MSERYELLWTGRAEKSLAKLERSTPQRILIAAEVLLDHPRPPAARHLVGTDGLYRIRIGDWRLIYQVQDDQLIILVVTLGHRREVYRQLP